VTRWEAPVRSFFLLLLLVTWSVPAAGQPAPSPNEPDSGALNDQAISLSQAGAYAEAIEIWWRILEREGPDYAHAVVIHRNIGRNYQKLGALPEARWHLGEAVRSTDKPHPKALEWLDAVDAALAAEHLEVVVDVEGQDGEVFLEEGGRLRGYPEPLAWWFRPGVYKISVRARDGVMRQHNLRIAPGRTRYLLTPRVAVKPPVEKTPPELPASVEPPPPPSRWTAVPAWKWALLGVGAAAIVGGGATYGVADARLADLRGDFRRDNPLETRTPASRPGIEEAWDDAVATDVRPLEISSYVLWGIGGAALVTGTVLVALDLVGDDPPPAGAPTVTPAPAGRGLLLNWTF
jgi:hypothetical protein